MIHKIKCLLILPLILLCSYGQAQTIVWAKKSKDAITDTKRLIVLQLDSTDIPSTKKYKKRKDLISAYAKYTRTFNEMIKTPILAHWHLCKQVDFMSVKDFLVFRKQASAKDKKETLVLLFEYPEYQFMNALEKLPSTALENIDFEKVASNGDYLQPIALFDLETVRSSIDGNRVAAAPTLALARMDINRWYLNASDIAFVVENMQMSMQATADQGNAFLFCINFSNTDKGKLMGKTLLIPEEYTIKMSTGKKTITEADIKKNYPWSWRFASYKEINAAIEQKDANTAVLFSSSHLIANKDGGTYFWVADAKDLRSILGYSTPGNKNFGVGTYMKENELYDLNERRLLEIVDNAKGQK